MKNTEKESIMVYPGPISTDKLDKYNTNVFEECYCQNGHSLITDEISFFDHPAIKVRIRHKKEVSDLYISPVIGDKCKATFNSKLKTDLVYEFLCPECNVTLPFFSPCSC